jgi:hypothetical protein
MTKKFGHQLVFDQEFPIIAKLNQFTKKFLKLKIESVFLRKK